MSIIEKIRQIKSLREERMLIVRREQESVRPTLNDLSKVPSIYDEFMTLADPDCKDNTKIFVLIVFYLYSPASLLNKRICRAGIRREIGKVLGLSNSAISKHFADAKSLMLNHKGFRAETEQLYEHLMDALSDVQV